MSTKIQVHADIVLPRVPNFLLFGDGMGKISIADITDDSLRGLGAEWTEALIKRAEEIRRAPRADE